MRRLLLCTALSIPHLATLVALAAELPTLDPNKFTICAITINSDNEKKVFDEQVKKNPEAFNQIVEITELGDRDDNNWFEKACASGIKCDQLIISGHFGGEFFGSSGKTLSLSKLEDKGCNKSCEGILSHPYEVFLFGCNTLATKEPDLRTPEQYLQVLLDDGIERNQAEQIVEARYGSSGDDNKSTMQRAFGGEQKQIFGFYSKGPSGSNVEGFLKKYFKKNDLKTHLQKLEADRLIKKTNFFNQNLGQILTQGGAAFAQCAAGSYAADKNQVVDEKLKIICGLRDLTISVEQKIALATRAFSRPDYLTFIPSISAFLAKHPPEKMSPKEKTQLSKITNNTTIKTRMIALINNTPSLSISKDWIDVSKKLGFIDSTQERKLLSARVNKLFEKNLTVSDKDLLCSICDEIRDKVDLDVTVIGKLKFAENDFFGLRCLANARTDKKLQLKLLTGLGDPDPNVRRVTAYAFTRINPQDKEIQLKLLTGLGDPDPNVRLDTAYAFRGIKPQDKEIQLKLLLTGLRDPNPLVRENTIYAFQEIKPQDKEIQLKLLKGLGDPDQFVQLATAHVFREIKPQDKEVINAIKAIDKDLGEELEKENFRKNVKKNVKNALKLLIPLGGVH